MLTEPDSIVHLTALLSTLAPEYTAGMKSKFKWLIFLLLLVLHLADNPAYACSINAVSYTHLTLPTSDLV